ncbi:hypothetical protein PCJ53_29110, partial [Klebsiella pneumoniae]|nr:hypothetical protein [Klebsiella pneumoniae]
NAQRVAFGIEEHENAVALIAVQHEIDRKRYRRRQCQPPPMNSRSGTPARNITVTPPITIISAVPRSGCFITKAAGTRISKAAGQIAPNRRVSLGGSMS